MGKINTKNIYSFAQYYIAAVKTGTIITDIKQQ